MSMLHDLIAAALFGRGGGGADAVRYTQQSLTDAQKAQARDNIGAEPEKFVVTLVSNDQGSTFTSDKTHAEIKAAYEAGKLVIAHWETWRRVYYLSDCDTQMAKFFHVEIQDCTIGDEHKVYVETVTLWRSVEALPIAPWRRDTRYLKVESTVTDDAATQSIEPAANTTYNCTAAALTSLTITNPPATGSYVIKFNSGSTATTTTIPSSIHGLESFAAEANTHYEINVEDNYAVIGKWAISV